jgi:hypothetical protein
MPRKVFTAGEVLAAADVNTYLMDQAVMTFAGTAARGSAIPSPTEGMVTYLADSDTFEFWNGTEYGPLAAPATPIPIDFLVIAGGGGGASCDGGFVGGGGGGAGGYRNSHGTSGANSAAEASFDIIPEANYTVTIGAGGAQNTNGSDSKFGVILSYGGCKGARTQNINTQPGVGGAGGGGQGATYSAIVGFGIPFQGSNGSTGWVNTGLNQGAGGGGGGASATGGTAQLQIGAPGGAGLASTITGSSVTRGGGGGGGAGNTGTTFAAGGAGGGGNGAAFTGGISTAGTVNTGGGGGGGAANVSGAAAGAAGGSGIVVLRYSDTYTITIGAGLTGTTATDGSDKVTTITAGDGTVSWA